MLVLLQKGQCQKGILEVHGTVRGSPVGPLLIHPPAQDLLHVSPVVKSAELHQLDHSPLAVSEQELQRGALGPLFQEAQFIIGHAPLAGKIPPVLHGRVARIQLYPDHIQQVLIIEQVADGGDPG